MKPNAITNKVAGANAEDIQRGIAAALAVFEQAVATAYGAASPAFKRESLHEGVYHYTGGHFADPHEGQSLWENEVRLTELSEREGVLAPIWAEADAAAVGACCAGWGASRILQTAYLSLLRESAPAI